MTYSRKRIVTADSRTGQEKSDVTGTNRTVSATDKRGLDVNIIGDDAGIGGGGASLPDTPTIYNVSLTTKDTEVSQALTANVRRFKIRNRSSGIIKLAYTSTESGTLFETIPSGAALLVDNINAGSLTLYMQSPKANQTVEVTEWV